MITSDENIKLILNNTEESILMADRDLKIVLFNQAASSRTKKIMGIDLKKGMSVLDIAKPERRALLEQLYQDVLNGKVHETEINVELNNGDNIYLVNNLQPARNSDGEIIGAIVQVRDITEKKLAEEELKQSEEQYRMLFQNNPVPAWIYDFETLRFFEANDAAVEIYGYTREEFMGMTLVDIRPEDEVPSLFEDLKHIEHFRHSLRNTWKHQKKNGEIMYVDLQSSNIQYNGKNARLVMAHDVTRKLQVENEIRKNNERFYYASQATSDIIWDWDVVTNMVFWAENLHNIFGHKLPPNSLLPVEECYEKFHPDDRDVVIHSLSEAFNDPEKNKWEQEFRYKKADGTYAYVVDRGYIIRDEAGKATRMIGAMRDITEQKYQHKLLALELQVFEINSTPNIAFNQVADFLLRGIEELHPEMYSSVLLLKEDGTVLHAAAPSLDPEYVKWVDGAHIGPQAGSCGTAMYRKEPVIVSDIESDPLWDNYREAATRFGLKACWSVPILNSLGEVMGSFAIYYKYTRQPGQAEWDTINRILNMLRILLENYLSLEKIKISKERYDIVARATHDLIWDWDLDTGYLYRDPEGVQKVYGIKNNETISHINDWLSHLHPDDLGNVQKVIDRIITSENEDSFDVEYRFRRDDGAYNYIYDRGVIMRNAAKKPYRMIGAAQNVTSRKLLEQELLQQEVTKQKIVSQAIIDTQESERAEIGKELHDNVNQLLTTTKLYLDLAQSNSDMRDELIKKSSANILYIINELRKISRALMLPSLGDLGLLDSIHDLAENINVTKHLKVEFNADGFEEGTLGENHKLMLFRIVQEALNNTINHGAATYATVQLQQTPEEIVLSVKDNGKGFDPNQGRKGVGLHNIQNRVSLFNGTLSINTAPGMGCQLVVKIPVKLPKI